jgi:hypothetical protein
MAERKLGALARREALEPGEPARRAGVLRRPGT